MSDQRGLLDAVKPKGDVRETAATGGLDSMLAGLLAKPRRRPRTDAEIERMLAADYVAYLALPDYSFPDLGDQPALSLDMRRAAVVAKGKFTARQVEIISAAIEHWPLKRLWASLYLLEDQPQARRVQAARRHQDERRTEATAAWCRLRAYATTIAGITETDDERRALDAVESRLIRAVVRKRERLARAKTDLAEAQSEGKRTTDERRQRVVQTLRSVLPSSSWTWMRIAELILAGASMTSAPCPRFATEHHDANQLAAWLRQRVRNRGV